MEVLLLAGPEKNEGDGTFVLVLRVASLPHSCVCVACLPGHPPPPASASSQPCNRGTGRFFRRQTDRSLTLWQSSKPNS